MERLMRVTCAVIQQDNKYLIVQRPKGSTHGLKWEFPGGKVEVGETDQECVEREIEEELAIKIQVLQQLQSVFTPYKKGMRVELIPFICSIKSGEIQLLEHNALQWIDIQEPIQQELCPGDYGIVDQLVERIHPMT